MQIIMFMYLAVLAFLFSPGILITLPPGGSRVVVALTHALVISLVWGLTHKLVYVSLK